MLSSRLWFFFESPSLGVGTGALPLFQVDVAFIFRPRVSLSSADFSD